MKVAIAQINPTVGDLEGNYKKIVNYTKEAYENGADIVIFPEGSIPGYPANDLMLEKSFIRENKNYLMKAVNESPDIVTIVGFIDYNQEYKLYNCAAIYKSGKIIGTIKKTLLPTYDVFDELRYFIPAEREEIKPVKVEIGGKTINLGVEICEDLWDHDYETKVTELLVERGAELIINISASPYFVGKGIEREELIKEKVRKTNTTFVYCNLVGGQDELVFDGQSLIVNKNAQTIYYGKKFEEELSIIELDLERGNEKPEERPIYNREEEFYNAIVLGIRDYFRKTGFKKAILGLSGGIDSSLVACLACDALGKNNVIGVSMPSKYSSDHSKSDAEQLANNLGILYLKFSIQDIVDMYSRVLEEPLKKVREYYKVSEEEDNSVADENIQPRVRANCLMDFSNRLSKLGILVLNTGNKTELALGYCTIYGDMTGGLSVIGDINKLDVYKLAKYVNIREKKEIIPENVFRKKPSAELKENQYDPFNFDIVSPLVDEIIENRRTKKELEEMGYPREEIDNVYERIRKAEYKRWQAPPTIKVTKRAFGIGWKMPIVNKYTDKYEEV
ncbi:MAG: NAD+ synthase [Candidatus Heimdallarchaeaceae archaeon]